MSIEITEIAEKASIPASYLTTYGHESAKVDLSLTKALSERKDGKLILVTAITPTKAGEGKTTVSIGLHDGFHKIGVNSLLCLREPSLGPVFGIKGGATGGGATSIIPSEDINLHFTGDFHAITSANNLIAAIIDNTLYQGNPLNIDPERIVWKRCMDMNDRALRDIEVSLGDPKATPHKAGFVITAASELMAVFCLSKDEEDFKERVNRMIVAFTKDGRPVTVKELSITNAIMKLMKKALSPNIVQTLEGNPVLVHGGPFANIAHGCNSLIATKMSLKLAPITVTEAGFGADLGAEKFLDIVCQEGQLHPDLVVLVATIRALKMHGGQSEERLSEEDVESLSKGVANLDRHIANMKKYGLPVLVAINRFASDTKNEIDWLSDHLEKEGVDHELSDGFVNGGAGCADLAKKAQKMLEIGSNYHSIYDKESSLKNKIETIAKEIYGASAVSYSELAESRLSDLEALGLGSSYVCMAKTPASFSDDPKLLGAPEGFTLHVRDVEFATGPGFVIPLSGAILRMPGLPKVPAAVKMEQE